jgi:hypothetical protein
MNKTQSDLRKELSHTNTLLSKLDLNIIMLEHDLNTLKHLVTKKSTYRCKVLRKQLKVLNKEFKDLQRKKKQLIKDLEVK